MIRCLGAAGRRLVLLVLFGVLAACATAPKPSAPVDAVSGPWVGRLALTVQDQPGQSFSAGFELKGTAVNGDLTLYSPIGGTLAALSWQPGKAMLRTGSKSTDFESVDALLAQVTGTPIPVGALFDWLRGVATPVPGWQPDVSQVGAGRLSAKRTEPPPQADLRVVLER